MKKIFGILALAVATASVCFALTACDEETHHYKKTVFEPTCTESGYTLYTCTDAGCDSQYTDDAKNALGHSYVDHFCSRCGEFDKESAQNTAGLEYAPIYDETGKAVTGYAVVGLGEAEIGNYIKLGENHEQEIDGKKISAPILRIDDGVFENLTNVRAVLLSNSVKEIGARAFFGCTALDDITLPTSVNLIGSGAFEGCSALKSMSLPYAAGIAVMEDNGKPKVDEWGNKVIDYKHFGYIFGADTYERNAEKIPASLKSLSITGSLKIVDNAFTGCGFQSVDIDGFVGTIGKDAFKNCSVLSSAVLGDGLMSIGDGAFYGCSALTELVIPESTSEIGLAALGGCSSLASISMPYACGGVAQGYKHFGYIFGADTYAQNGATVPASLKKVSVTGPLKIADNAFNGLKITYAEIAGKVGTIGANAFKNCTALTEAVLGTGLKQIGEGAFYGCTALYEFTFGKGVKNIGTNAFYYCNSLGTVCFNGTLAEFGVTKYADMYSSPLAYGADLFVGGDKIHYKR